MKLLSGKKALVTGAGMGIGRAIATTYAREGADVAVLDINRQAGEETVHSINSNGGKAIFIEVDVTSESRIAESIARVSDTFGRLDIACNSAALTRGAGYIHEYSRATFDETLEFCLTSTWLCMKYEIQQMLSTGGGAIVNISSNAALRGHPFNTAYAAAKSGVNTLTMSSAAEYGSKGIRINAVSPGVIKTPAVERYFSEQPKLAKKLEESALMKRLGEPSEIAEAVCFLSSDRASFITGQILSVDGGNAVK